MSRYELKMVGWLSWNSFNENNSSFFILCFMNLECSLKCMLAMARELLNGIHYSYIFSLLIPNINIQIAPPCMHVLLDTNQTMTFIYDMNLKRDQQIGGKHI
jgi:hypothetical protein